MQTLSEGANRDNETKHNFPVRALNTRRTKCLHRSKHLLGNISTNTNAIVSIQHNQDDPLNSQLEVSQLNRRQRNKNRNHQIRCQSVISQGPSSDNQTNHIEVNNGDLLFGSTRSGKTWRNDILQEIFPDDHG